MFVVHGMFPSILYGKKQVGMPPKQNGRLDKPGGEKQIWPQIWKSPKKVEFLQKEFSY